ncbi:MAG: acyl carrier protein [Acidimicrobiales bacterium]
MTEEHTTPPTRDQDEIRTWLRLRIAELLEIDPGLVDPSAPFESYGMASSDAVFLSGDLSEFLGIRVSATVAWDVATVDELSALLAAVLRGEVELPEEQFEWDLDADLIDPS